MVGTQEEQGTRGMRREISAATQPWKDHSRAGLERLSIPV